MKKTIHENWRVVVEVDDKYEAGEVKQQIERHVDGAYSSFRTQSRVSTEFDSREICSFCEREWEECDGDEIISPHAPTLTITDIDIEGLPACCDAAQNEFYGETFGTQDDEKIIKIVLDRMRAAALQKERDEESSQMARDSIEGGA